MKSTSKLEAITVAFTTTIAAISAAILFSCAAPSPAYAEETRNTSLIQQYKELNVCPSTGLKATKGNPASYRCPGYVVDHGIPFCAGKYVGANFDKLHNLAYQKYDDENSLRKDADERLLCATLRHLILKNEKN